MKIALTSKSYLPMLGGSINYIHMLAMGFVDLGCDVRLATRTPDPDFEAPEVNYSVERSLTSKELKDLAKWSDVLLQVDSSWRDAWPFFILGKPWFPSVHRSVTYKDYQQGIELRLRYLAEWVSYRIGHTIFVSNTVKETWRLPGTVIPNPYLDNVFDYQSDIDKDYDYIFVGRLAESKGILQALKQATRIAKENLGYNIRFAVVGSGDAYDEVCKIVDKAPTNLSIKLYGKLPAESVADVMKRSNILVFPTMPSWGEASPLTLLEAQACGCRVIAADNGGSKENLGTHSVLYNSGDEKRLGVLMEEYFLTSPLKMEEVDKEFLNSRKLHATCLEYIDLFNSKLKS